MALETRATYETARRWLEEEKPVRLKAVAAGTGLSMILVYDRLIRDGYNPALITATITDREEANIANANCLLDKLATTRDRKRSPERGFGISARKLKTSLRKIRAEPPQTWHDTILSPP